MGSSKISSKSDVDLGDLCTSHVLGGLREFYTLLPTNIGSRIIYYLFFPNSEGYFGSICLNHNEIFYLLADTTLEKIRRRNEKSNHLYITLNKRLRYADLHCKTYRSSGVWLESVPFFAAFVPTS